MKSGNVFYLSLFRTVTIITGNVSAQTKQKFESNFVSLEKSNPVPSGLRMPGLVSIFAGEYIVPAFANDWYPRNMFIKGSNENKHHIAVYGDPTEWPYNNFITGAKVQ